MSEAAQDILHAVLNSPLITHPTLMLAEIAGKADRILFALKFRLLLIGVPGRVVALFVQLLKCLLSKAAAIQTEDNLLFSNG